MNQNINIHWFRQDLRLNDNPSLFNAAKNSNLLPIYIYDNKNQEEFHIGNASKIWLYYSLKSLNNSLDGKLYVYIGDPKEILSELNINNNERLDKLHFIISYNKFIKNNDVILEELDNYFLKLINSNINKKVFNNSSLINLLMKKILIVFYYKMKKRKIKDIILFLFKSHFLKYLIRYKLGFKK